MAPPKRFEAKTRQTWRQWLIENHDEADNVWLVTFKKGSGEQHLEYADSVEEALCFGWVDSRPKSLDDRRSMRLFSRRSKGSPWSKLNKQRIRKLESEGLMAAAGMQAVRHAKKDGSWSVYDDIEALVVPDDLEQALDANRTAKSYFDQFPDSSKKNILWWIKSAKRDITRNKRIAETVELAEQGIRANHYRQPKKR